MKLTGSPSHSAFCCGGLLRPDVYESVRSGECPIGLIPQENSIHGIVIEAYDILRGPDVGREVFVRGEVTISIQHCLITRKGVALEDVKRILSHEQVLYFFHFHTINIDSVHHRPVPSLLCVKCTFSPSRRALHSSL